MLGMKEVSDGNTLDNSFLYNRKVLHYNFLKKTLIFPGKCTKIKSWVVESGVKWYEMGAKWRAFAVGDKSCSWVNTIIQ